MPTRDQISKRAAELAAMPSHEKVSFDLEELKEKLKTYAKSKAFGDLIRNTAVGTGLGAGAGLLTSDADNRSGDTLRGAAAGGLLAGGSTLGWQALPRSVKQQLPYFERIEKIVGNQDLGEAINGNNPGGGHGWQAPYITGLAGLGYGAHKVQSNVVPQYSRNSQLYKAVGDKNILDDGSRQRHIGKITSRLRTYVDSPQLSDPSNALQKQMYLDYINKIERGDPKALTSLQRAGIADKELAQLDKLTRTRDSTFHGGRRLFSRGEFFPNRQKVIADLNSQIADQTLKYDRAKMRHANHMYQKMKATVPQVMGPGTRKKPTPTKMPDGTDFISHKLLDKGMRYRAPITRNWGSRAAGGATAAGLLYGLDSARPYILDFLKSKMTRTKN